MPKRSQLPVASSSPAAPRKRPNLEQPRAPLFCSFGSDGASTMLVRVDGKTYPSRRREGTWSQQITIEAWSRALVRMTWTTRAGIGKIRIFVLEPAVDAVESRVDFAHYQVSGGLRIVEKINNARRAREAWEAR